jgi:hypothetical protein
MKLWKAKQTQCLFEIDSDTDYDPHVVGRTPDLAFIYKGSSVASMSASSVLLVASLSYFIAGVRSEVIMTDSQLPYKDGTDSCQFNLLHKNVDTDWNTCIQAIRVLRDLNDLRARRMPVRMIYKVYDTYVLGFSACHYNVLTRNTKHRSKP